MDDRALGPKVAIPKLDGRVYTRRRQKRHETTRIQRACDNCHKRKTRCSGERPHCQNCVGQQLQCVYPQGRKDRLKEVTEQNGELIALLKDLNAHTDEYGQKKLDEVLGTLGENIPTSSVVSSLEERAEGPKSENKYDEDGPMDEDRFRSRHSRATGFVGRNSEVQWLRSLKMQMENSEAPNLLGERMYGVLGGRGLHVSDSTFYLDSDDLEVDVVVDLYELPPVEEATRLFNYYTHTVHSSFPIVPDEFEQQFHKYLESIQRGRRYQVPDSWQAMLNLIFAIGAQYSCLTEAEPRTEAKSHLIYMTRATQLLGLNNLITALSAPTMSIIQATALLSLYFLAIGQIRRAWMMIGISLRFALATGLHLRNDDPSVPKQKKHSQVRTWWSIQSIESLVCALIGRPCTIPNDECTVPLPFGLSDDDPKLDLALDWVSPIQRTPADFPEATPLDASNRGNRSDVVRASYFGARIVISLLMRKALSKLYLPQTSADRWDQIQKEIISLSRELDDWVSEAFPNGILWGNSCQDTVGQREQLLLSFQYHSARLLIYRPCLCRLEQRLEKQSDVSAQFNQSSAEACVQAAHAVARLFPEEPSLGFIYQKSPWWCIVHNIMQAIAVFLLDMFYGQIQVTEHSETTVGNLRKLIRWLQFMSTSNVVAGRAYDVVSDMVTDSAVRLGLNVSDILAKDVGHRNPRPQQSPATPQSTAASGYNFVQPGWGIPFVHPLGPAPADPPYPINLVPEQPVTLAPELPTGRNIALDPMLQIPPICGNPFFNNFDFSNPLDEASPQAGWYQEWCGIGCS